MLLLRAPMACAYCATMAHAYYLIKIVVACVVPFFMKSDRAFVCWPAAGCLPNVTIPFGSTLPDSLYSGPYQGVEFIAAMAPKRMPVMPAGATQPCAVSPSRRPNAAWTRFKDGVLHAFYVRLHQIWTTAFEHTTSADPYYVRMPRLGSLVDRYLFHNTLGINYPDHPVDRAYHADLVDEKMEESGDDDEEMEEQWDW